MGMISCRDCGKVLSRSAKRCPLCGAIKPGRSSVEYYLHRAGNLLSVIGMLLGLGWALIGW